MFYSRVRTHAAAALVRMALHTRRYFMIPLSFDSQKILIVTGVSGALLLFATTLFYQAYAAPLIGHLGSSGVASPKNGKVYLSAEAAAVASTTPQKAPMLEVHIANNGLVLLRGAHVLSISGSTIHVGMAWDSSSFTWQVETNYNTKILNSKGEKQTLADIESGDTVTVTGMLVGGGGEPTVDATFVREK